MATGAQTISSYSHVHRTKNGTHASPFRDATNLFCPKPFLSHLPIPPPANFLFGQNCITCLCLNLYLLKLVELHDWLRLNKIPPLEICRERTFFQSMWINRDGTLKKIWKEVQEGKLCGVGHRDRHRSDGFGSNQNTC